MASPLASATLSIGALPSRESLRSGLWVDVALARDASRWISQFEALELLALLARVDARAAWTLLLNAVHQTAYVDMLVDVSAPWRFRLRVPWDKAALARLTQLLGGSDHELSPSFAVVKRVLQASLSEEKERVETCVPVCLLLASSDVPSAPDDTPMLARLAQLAEDYRSSPRGIFRWTHVALTSRGVATLDALLDGVQRLFACGLRVELLTLTQRVPIDDLVGAARFWRRSLVETNAIHSLTLSSAVDHQTFHGICSALAASSASRKIAFWPHHGGDRSPRELVARWSWLAVALFRATSCTRVLLDLSHLTLEQATAVARIVAASDPLHVLCSSGDARGEASVDCVVDLHAGARSTASRTRGTSVRDAVDWTGLGTCWVRRQDIVRYYEVPRRSHRACVERLKLVLSTTTSLEAVRLLVRTIGTSVRRLTVDGGYSSVDDAAFWTQLLAACPSLERLDVTNVALSDLTWLIPCRLHVLSLDGVFLEHPEETLTVLFHALADTTRHPLSQSLREFHTQWETARPCFDALLAMLATNRRLEKCILSTETDPASWHATRMSEFTACTITPPPLRTTLAFVSVVQAVHASDGNRRVPYLEPHVQSRIVAFAIPQRRQCAVVYREW